MAAADLGMIYDGQMVSAAAACHLPTMVLIKMRMHHQWFSDLYNQWWNEMNILSDNNIYPELIGGEAWYGKIADTLAEWYVKPDTRYEMARKFEVFVKEGMSYKQLDRNVVRSKNLILHDGMAYDEFKDPMRQVAHKLWEDMQAYDLKTESCHNLAELGSLKQ
jgi:hypothetical protein